MESMRTRGSLLPTWSMLRGALGSGRHDSRAVESRLSLWEEGPGGGLGRFSDGT